MIDMTLRDIADAVGGELHDVDDPEVRVTGTVEFDSRRIGPGGLFLALPGEHADGHDYAADWIEVPDNDAFENGFKTQWEEFIRHVVDDGPNRFDFLAGARGVLLAEKGLASSESGCRVELPVVSIG